MLDGETHFGDSVVGSCCFSKGCGLEELSWDCRGLYIQVLPLRIVVVSGEGVIIYVFEV